MKNILIIATLVTGCASTSFDTDLDENGFPIPLAITAPIYPPEALETNLEGWVQVSYTITVEGAVSDLRIVDYDPTNTTIFNEPCLLAVSSFKYRPRKEPFDNAQYVCSYSL